jgi:hypothetical protein
MDNTSIEKFCSHVREIDGQACVAVALPESGSIAVYDLDSASLFECDLDDWERAVKVRPAEVEDYERSVIMGSKKYADSAFLILCTIERFDDY